MNRYAQVLTASALAYTAQASAAAKWARGTTMSSPGALFRTMNAAQRQALFDNTARQIGAAAKHIQERHIANCTKADPACGAGVAQAIARLV
jgi:catalase